VPESVCGAGKGEHLMDAAQMIRLLQDLIDSTPKLVSEAELAAAQALYASPVRIAGVMKQ
jgi:hypothetical protein